MAIARRPSRRDHHGRQRPLGGRARRCRCSEGHREGARTLKQTVKDAVAPRPRRAVRVRVLDRELVAARRRGRGPDGDVRGADHLRDARSSTRRACGCASSAAATGVSRELQREDGLGRGDHGRQRAPEALRRLQLRRPRRDPGRRRALRGGRRGGVRRGPLRARDGRARPGHPHQRREPALELPALADRLFGAGLRRTSCGPTSRSSTCRKRCASSRRDSAVSAPDRFAAWSPREDRGDERSSAFDFDLNVELEFDRIGREPGREPWRSSSRPAFVSETPAEGDAARRSPARSSRNGAAPKRKRGSARSETLARILWAIPWIVFAVTIVVAGRAHVRRGDGRVRVHRPLGAVPDDQRRPARCRSSPSPPARA